MGYNMNFDAKLKITSGGVTVTGTSEPLDGAHLVSRQVLLRQDTVLKDGPAPGGATWTSEPLGAGEYQPGPALANGIETHVVDNADSQTGTLAMSVTVNWSQIVTLET
jgi:hypothetical protein